MRRIVLASASPRRKELLEKLGLVFEVLPSGCKEEKLSGASPRALAEASALLKARAAAAKLGEALIIAADTLGVADGVVLGKPKDTADAEKMLRRLSGRCHRVITGLAVLDTATGKTATRSVETRVYFKRLTADEINAYIESGEPLDKAGAYAIQGLGAVLVERVEGDYYNVVGLPLSALADMLKEFGVDLLRAGREKNGHA